MSIEFIKKEIIRFKELEKSKDLVLAEAAKKERKLLEKVIKTGDKSLLFKTGY